MKNSSTMYQCPCGRVFDDKETYLIDSMPLYGKTTLRVDGKVILCHICRETKVIPALKTTIQVAVINYLHTHKKLCSSDIEKLGISNKNSFITILNLMCTQHKITQINPGKRPLYYKLTKEK